VLFFSLKPDPAIKGIATAGKIWGVALILSARLKPDPAIKGIATENFFSHLLVTTYSSETRPCYKRDCDISLRILSLTLSISLCLKPDPAIKGIATPPEPTSILASLRGRLKPDPAIKGIATSLFCAARTSARNILRSETRPCYKRDCDVDLFSNLNHRFIEV